ncbi:hypothetical protein ABI59_05830 [Acidobacteria bacterium Mor1]|nr:hypothetical protein ABI59_05830 [Acidobacteria bacterium Mor1]
MKVLSSRFERATARPQDEPQAAGRDVVFLGRSNVGKSSLINRLLRSGKLAKTSSTPGKTQTVNFYRINEAFYFIDLPGYGFAKVPKSVQAQWAPMIEGFLERRRDRIAIALMLVDSRHKPTRLDRAMKQWLEHYDVPHLIVATKADKLSGNKRTAAARILADEFGPFPEDGAPILASSSTGLGIRQIWAHLDRALT